jgi:uncharacterized membrane protein
MFIILPFGIIAIFGGFIAYKLNQKAARDIEQMRIRSRLAQIEREKEMLARGETLAVQTARTRRVRSRR